MKLAALDLGTNTCRLLLAEVEDGAHRAAGDGARRTSCGWGRASTGRGGSTARRWRARAACSRPTPLRVDAYRPERRLLVATSVLRDAADGAAFLAAVERDLDLPYRVVDGEEEARLAFRGATASLEPDAAEVAVVDIGGGSTEFAVGGPGRPPRFVRSLDMGAVRITERFFADDPPTAAQWRAAVEFVDGLLHAGLPADVRAGVGAVVGVAGTFTTLVAHQLGLRVYDPALVHGRLLTLAQIDVADPSLPRPHQRRARPPRRDQEGARGRDPRRRAHRAGGLSRLRRRGRPRQRVGHPRRHRPLARRRLPAAGCAERDVNLRSRLKV